jgi:hypothetical protein
VTRSPFGSVRYTICRETLSFQFAKRAPQLPAPLEDDSSHGAHCGDDVRHRKPGAGGKLPQSALPAVIAPKKTLTNMAKPRPRTQSGGETWTDTLTVARTATHEMPAITQAVGPTAA